jgi:molybdenum cofactor synthesis domain-containing protein
MPSTLKAQGLSIAREKGTPHDVVDQLTLTLAGIEGDRHAGPGLRQLSLMHASVARHYFPDHDDATLPGAGTENLLVDGEGLADLHLLDTLEIGDALLEITQIGREVNASGKSLCSAQSKCLLSDHGVFGRVVHGGVVRQGQAIHHQHRLLRAHIITVSDRASRGDYEDKSGPRARALLDAWCQENRWGLWVESQIVPDEREALEAALDNARQSRVDLVITTGGTGVAPRDITPDVVRDRADKLIPGIMEHIRMKYGDDMPLALTSRAVAATMDRALVYTLPGSVNAIGEYLDEIFKTMEHMLFLLRGVQPH